jgi:Ca-activated chloride channel family protein
MAARRHLTILVAHAAVAALALPAGAAGQEASEFTGEPIVGGGSFNDAPRVEPGTYTDTVVSGETNFYRVALLRGQRLEASATVDASALQRDSSEPDYDEGLDNQDYRLDLWSPLREPLVDENSEAGLELEGDENVGIYSGAAATRIVLGYGEVLASDFDVQKFEGPGDYYVEVAALPDDIFDRPRTRAELPVQFDIRVIGEGQPSDADFAQSLPDAPDDMGEPGPTEGSEAPEEPEEATSPLGSGGGDSSSLAVIAVFAGFALLSGAAVGALTGLALRRRPAS